MKSDSEIKRNLLEALKDQPEIEETGIGVVVKQGIVTLMGSVRNLSQKLAAEQAVKRVAGVRGLALDLRVDWDRGNKLSDTEIAAAAADMLAWSVTVPKNRISIKVEDGRLFVSGKVAWGYQKYAALHALKSIQGVREIYARELVIEPAIRVVNVRHKIERALERLADVDASDVDVEVHGDTVFLKGAVRSVIEKEAAEHAALRAPGVRRVINELKVRYYPAAVS